jgi:hypothetical protein
MVVLSERGLYKYYGEKYEFGNYRLRLVIFSKNYAKWASNHELLYSYATGIR